MTRYDLLLLFIPNVTSSIRFQYQNPETHKAKLSHEVIAAAASYEAAKAYEDHCAKNGKPGSHAYVYPTALIGLDLVFNHRFSKAKELLFGLAGAFIDREVETKGWAKYNIEQGVSFEGC